LDRPGRDTGDSVSGEFFLLAFIARRAGVAIAAPPTRLSVAIPSVLAFVFYGDSVTAAKIAGILAGLVALLHS